MSTQNTSYFEISRNHFQNEEPKTILDKIKEQIRNFLENAE